VTSRYVLCRVTHNLFYRWLVHSFKNRLRISGYPAAAAVNDDDDDASGGGLVLVMEQEVKRSSCICQTTLSPSTPRCVFRGEIH